MQGDKKDNQVEKEKEKKSKRMEKILDSSEKVIQCLNDLKKIRNDGYIPPTTSV
jgi:hypothetical protein